MTEELGADIESATSQLDVDAVETKSDISKSESVSLLSSFAVRSHHHSSRAPVTTGSPKPTKDQFKIETLQHHQCKYQEEFSSPDYNLAENFADRSCNQYLEVLLNHRHRVHVNALVHRYVTPNYE